MKTAIETLENLFYEKILLYQDLVECLKRERDCLTKTDIDRLWEIADEKQSAVSRIESVRGKILSALSEAAIDHQMDAASFDLACAYSLIPGMHAERIKTAYLSLVALKGEIRQRSQENRLFIEESLDFLDELIGIIAGTGKQNAVYDNGRSLRNKGQANLLLYKEV